MGLFKLSLGLEYMIMLPSALQPQHICGLCVHPASALEYVAMLPSAFQPRAIYFVFIPPALELE